MKKITFAVLIYFCVLGFTARGGQAVWAEEGIKTTHLYFVRHAETMANATGDNSEINQRTFTELGRDQVLRVTEELKDYSFDAICVSPIFRTRQTIRPYLEGTSRTAEIWPELAECCWESDRNVQPSAAALQKGAQINILPEEKLFFAFRSGEQQSFMFAVHHYADGMMLVEKACQLIKERFEKTGKSVLLVGHSLSSGRIIESLLGNAPEGHLHPRNAEIIHIREDNGEYFIVHKKD